MKKLLVMLLVVMPIGAIADNDCHNEDFMKGIGRGVGGAVGFFVRNSFAGRAIAGSIGALAGTTAGAAAGDFWCENKDELAASYLAEMHAEQVAICTMNPTMPGCVEVMCVDNPMECSDIGGGNGFDISHQMWAGMNVDFRLIHDREKVFISIMNDLAICGACTASEVLAMYNLPDSARWSYFEGLRSSRGYGALPSSTVYVAREIFYPGVDMGGEYWQAQNEMLGANNNPFEAMQ